MSHLTTEELLQLRRRTVADVWLNSVEDALTIPGLRQKYVNRLHEIDMELVRRGVAVA